MFAIVACAFVISSTAQTPSADPSKVWWVFLERTKTPLRVSKEEGDKLQAAHIGNFKRLFKLKRLIAAGPLDDIPGGTKRGIVVLTVASRKDVQDCFIPDPYVQANVFNVHAIELSVKLGRFELEKMDPNGIEENRLVVFTAAYSLSKEASEAHWKYLSGLGGLSRPSFGAGANEEDDIRGVALFRGKADLQPILDDDPIIKSGVLKATIYPQWLAKGTLP